MDSNESRGAESPLSRHDCSAAISPSGQNVSRRQDRLSQEARDILAYAFAEGVPANDLIPIPMSAAEVLIGNGDIDRIMLGGGFHKHGGSDSLKYFKHADDEAWALVFAHDCDGDPERGRQLVASYSPNTKVTQMHSEDGAPKLPSA